MMRSSAFVLTLVGVLAVGEGSLAAVRGQIIPQTTARRHGFTRPWFNQVQLDRARGRVSHMVLYGGTLFVQTDQAVLHALDAETGQTLWTAEVGRRGHPSLTPGANHELVAVVNGSFLYVLDRRDGKLVWKAQVEGVPGAGAALGEHRAYVATVTGMVLSYQLKPEKDPLEELGKTEEAEQEALQAPKALLGEEQSTPEEPEVEEADTGEAIRLQQEFVPPLVCQSFGRALVQPIVTRRTEADEYVAWATDRGFLFVGHLNENEEQFSMRYRLETEAGIAAQPTYLPPDPETGGSGIIYAASRDGFVHAISETAGQSLWRFSAAEPILQPAVVIGDSVYVVTQPGGMHCLDARTGAEKWWTTQVAQFIAVSKDRLYVADKLDRILALNAATGARLDTVPVQGFDLKLTNMETDRIYLATSTGLVQCLHEMQLTEPIRHLQPLEVIPEKPALAEEAAEPEPKQPAVGGPFDKVQPGPVEAAKPKPAGPVDESPFD